MSSSFFSRLFFFLLLIANLALFIWLRQQPVPSATASPPRHDRHIPSLRLLSELERENPVSTGLGLQADAHGIVPVCFRIGPFSTQAVVSQLQETLQDFMIKARLRRETASQEAGYWVFLPAAASRAQALKTARRLSDAGIKDYYVVTAGARENTVSLGLYRDKENAMSRLERLRQRGFDAQWEARLEQWPEYWLDVALASDQAEKLPAIVAEKQPDSSIFSSTCDW